MANKSPNKSTQFKPGQSGNYNGRPKGAKSKYSTKQIAAILSEHTEDAINRIYELMSSKNDNVAIKAALSLITEDIKLRELVMKEVQDKLKIKQMKIDLALSEEKLKEVQNKPTDSNEEKEEDNMAPVLSLTAIQGAKQQ